MGEVTDWALYNSRASRGARLVLTCLADNANGRGIVALSINRLAEMVSLSRQAVGAAIGRLIEVGDLVLVEGGSSRRAAVYRLACHDENGRFIGGETQTETTNTET